MSFYLSAASKRNREGVDPRWIEISDLAITITNVDFGHGRYAGKRSATLQNELYLDGKSQLDGYIRKSYHQSGKALDFYAYVNGRISYEPLHMAMVAAAFLQAACILGYSIEWGGLWTPSTGKIVGWDSPHLQIRD